MFNVGLPRSYALKAAPLCFRLSKQLLWLIIAKDMALCTYFVVLYCDIFSGLKGFPPMKYTFLTWSWPLQFQLPPYDILWFLHAAWGGGGLWVCCRIVKVKNSHCTGRNLFIYRKHSVAFHSILPYPDPQSAWEEGMNTQ